MPTAKQGATKKSAAKQASTKVAAKPPTTQGLMKAVQPSAELAVIVGNTPLPRTEITNRIWDYIKAHGLQDAQNKRMINADSTLLPLFGGQEQVSMLELPKRVSRHVQYASGTMSMLHDFVPAVYPLSATRSWSIPPCNISPPTHRLFPTQGAP